MQCDSFRKVFLSIYFLMVPLVPRVYLIGKINASYRFFSLSRQTVNKNFLVKNERVEFHVTHVVDNNDSSWERERKKKEIIIEFRVTFFERREKKKEQKRKCGNERKMENRTVRENLKFYQMESIREPLPPRFISNDGKVYSKVIPVINIYFSRRNLLASFHRILATETKYISSLFPLFPFRKRSLMIIPADFSRESIDRFHRVTRFRVYLTRGWLAEVDEDIHQKFRWSAVSSRVSFNLK